MLRKGAAASKLFAGPEPLVSSSLRFKSYPDGDVEPRSPYPYTFPGLFRFNPVANEIHTRLC